MPATLLRNCVWVSAFFYAILQARWCVLSYEQTPLGNLYKYI